MNSWRCVCRPIVLGSCLLSILGATGCSESQRAGLPAADSPEWHAQELAAGDYRVLPEKEAECDYITVGLAGIGVPYHVRRLIHWGPRSAEALIGLLDNMQYTDIPFYGDTFSLTFSWTRNSAEKRARPATVADLADFALCRIYGTDVGFRSYLPYEARKNAIRMWKQIVRECPKGDVRPEVTVSAQELEERREAFHQFMKKEGAPPTPGWGLRLYKEMNEHPLHLHSANEP
jgi:hypothetical protein